MKPITMTLCASVLMALALPAQAAGDPKAGQVKTSMCAGCHGMPGWRTQPGACGKKFLGRSIQQRSG